MDSGSARRGKIVSACCAAAGGLGAVACSVSMTLAGLGLIGTTAAASGAMAGMQGLGSQPGGSAASASRVSPLVNVLLQAGPAILVVSMALLALSLGIRRRRAALAAMIVAAVMYWGMYGQRRLFPMYVSIAVGFVAWVVLFLWTFRPMALRFR